MGELATFLIPQAVLAAAVMVAAGWDLRTRRIPNWLCLTLAALGVVAAVLRPDLTVWQSLAGVGIGLLVPFVLFAMGMLGAGDAKLLAAIGAWMGPVGILWVLLFTAIAGALLSVSIALGQGRLSSLFRNSAAIGMSLLVTRRTGWVSATEVAQSSVLQKTTVPYALAILVGLLAVQAMLCIQELRLV